MTKSAKELVSAANSSIETQTPESATEQAKQKGAVFVDVRETDELRKTGKLKGAVHAPRGFLEFQADPSSPNHNPVLRSGKQLILYCASGGRSALAAATLKNMGVDNVSHVAGGFPALKSAGADTKDVG
jgi:rhodanese-related sulfurtransferase